MNRGVPKAVRDEAVGGKVSSAVAVGCPSHTDVVRCIDEVAAPGVV